MTNEPSTIAAEERFLAGNQRFRYFLLAAAGAALGYALAQPTTTDLPWWIDLPWLAALICWATSLGTGIYSVEFHNKELTLDYTTRCIQERIQEFERKQSLELRSLDGAAEALADKVLREQIHQLTEEIRDTQFKLNSLQKWCLLLGAWLYGIAIVIERFGGENWAFS